jgi:hypothetical protein
VDECIIGGVGQRESGRGDEEEWYELGFEAHSGWLGIFRERMVSGLRSV